MHTSEQRPELLRSRPLPISMLLAGGALCNDATLHDDGDGKYHTVGDPTEGALLVAALLGGRNKVNLEHTMLRVAELPFDSDRKRMTTVHARPAAGLSPLLQVTWGKGGYAPEAPYLGITKGAVDGLLEVTASVWLDDHAAPLTDELRQRILRANEGMARNGMRVLGVAFRPLRDREASEAIERELVFVGLFGMIDPPRPEVRAAVATCRSAGIRPVMITGDHPLTASYIARDLGIASDDRVVTGAQLNTMSDEELARVVATTSVFARVSPEHKLKIVAALQGQGQVVAMTGDGVNDAPALKQADIGVAMGLAGTDVAREAADMILTDDDFATIEAAVEEGRGVFDNLTKIIAWTLPTNLGEGLVILAAILVGAALPILPIQILWINMTTVGVLGLVLALEGKEPGMLGVAVFGYALIELEKWWRRRLQRAAG